MWDCDHCGCQAIAGTITVCPMCGTPREEVVPAESSASDASSPAIAVVDDRETPQAPGSEETDEEDWGSAKNGKVN